jgi:hypothetical protein
MLKRHDLRQLAQRISVMARLEPLDEKETARYIRHRIERAGGDPALFHKNALRLIYWNSGGIPRVINTLCELALVYAYADRKQKIDAVLIADIARDRIGTGLYGTEVFDVNTLRNSDAAHKRERKSRSAAAGSREHDAAVPQSEAREASTVADNKVFDLPRAASSEAAAKKTNSGV